MKISPKILILQLIILALFTSCNDPDDPNNLDNELDTFTVTVDENPHVPGNMISYNSGENTSTFCFSPTMTKDGKDDGVWIAETELTYALWKEVYNWAVDAGYSLYKNAQPGSNTDFPDTHPVTRVGWYDAVVWCNAYTAYYNFHNGDKPDYGFVYTINGDPVKDSDPDNTSFGSMTIDHSKMGFRLPTNEEWYYAAKYPSTPDDYASGATGNCENTSATENVAWYNACSSAETHPVKEKTKNQLNLYDMSGNVKEIVLDKLAEYNGDYNNRGGAYNSAAENVTIGNGHQPIEQHSSSVSQGFRIARTIGDDNNAGFNINTGGGSGSCEAGHGTGYLKMGGDSVAITKAMGGDYNTLLQGGYLQLDLFTEGLSVNKDVNWGFEGSGSQVGLWPIMTQNTTLVAGEDYLDDAPLLSAYIDFDASITPWEAANGFIANNISVFTVEKEDDIYTITIKATGTDNFYNENVPLEVFYHGTINYLIAGQDY